MTQENEISTATINHFTKFEHLKCILSDKCFKPRYCLENINHINWAKLLDVEDLGIKEFPKLAYPMVCFTDLPHDKWPIHKATYGPCIITLSENWKLKNGLIPVIYLVHKDFMSDNLLPKCLCMAKRYCLEHREKEGYINFVNMLIPYLKLYSEGDKRYYDEREWRYFPWKGLDHKYFTLTEEEWNDKFIREMRQNELISDDTNLLFFTFEDIVCIEVSNNEEKEEIAKIMAKSFQKDVKTVVSRINIDK